MNAPWIWIILPMVVAAILFFLRANQKIAGILSIISQLLLAAMAGLLPIGMTTKVGPFVIEISSTLNILGRRLVLENTDRSYLVYLFILGAVWAFLTMVVKPDRLMPSLQLTIIVLLVSARAVEPFLFGALLIEMAILTSIPMMVPPGTSPSRGVMRYLIFQTLALPFILLAGWAFGMVQIDPANKGVLLRASVALGLGFAFWLAVFPFYSWIPMLSEKVHPIAFGFILSLLPFIILMLGLDFLNGYIWIKQGIMLVPILQVTGLVMIVTGGVWAAFQRNLSRLVGYAIILDTGFMLLAVSLQNRLGMETFAANWIPRQISLLILIFGLSVLRSREIPPTIEGIKGIGTRFPILASAMALAMASFIGLPLTGGFPVRETLLGELGSQMPLLVGWVLVGVCGFLFSMLRCIASFFHSDNNRWNVEETWYEGLIIIAAMVLLIGTGIFPAGFYKGIFQLLSGFPNLP